MKNLPGRYAALVARRPELAVTTADPENASTVWALRHQHKDWPGVHWMWFLDDDATDPECVDDPSAAALIRCRLEDALPMFHCLTRATDSLYWVVNEDQDYWKQFPSPIEALFAFWESQP